MALIALGEDRYADAKAHLLDGLTVARRTQERLGTVVALYGLAVIAHAQGDPATARDRLVEGLLYAYRTGDENSPALFLHALADIDARTDPGRATRLAGAARSLRRSPGAIWLAAYVPSWPTRPVDLRSALGDADFEQADREGAALGLERALELVQPPADVGRPASGSAGMTSSKSCS